MCHMSVVSSAGRCLCVVHVISKAGSRARYVVSSAGIYYVCMFPVVRETKSGVL